MEIHEKQNTHVAALGRAEINKIVTQINISLQMQIKVLPAFVSSYPLGSEHHREYF